MAHSIESRVPFLDHRLVEFSLGLPDRCKITDGVTKWILREAMRGTLPESVRRRRDKIGFDTPQNEWLRSMAEQISDVLLSDRFADRRFINPDVIPGTMEKLKYGGLRDSSAVWRWLNLELWFRCFVD